LKQIIKRHLGLDIVHVNIPLQSNHNQFP